MIREKDYVWVRGDPRGDMYRVEYIGVALGGHYQEAHPTLVRESWSKPNRREPLENLEPVPPDLPDFPCWPV